MGITLKRFLSFYVDLFIAAGISIIVSNLVESLFKSDETTSTISVFVITVVGVMLFLLKDISGRSVGKRIFKLKIIDRNHPDAKVSVRNLILRNILAFLWMIDGYLLYSGTFKYKMMDKKLGLDVISEQGGNTILRTKLR